MNLKEYSQEEIMLEWNHWCEVAQQQDMYCLRYKDPTCPQTKIITLTEFEYLQEKLDLIPIKFKWVTIHTRHLVIGTDVDTLTSKQLKVVNKILRQEVKTDHSKLVDRLNMVILIATIGLIILQAIWFPEKTQWELFRDRTWIILSSALFLVVGLNGFKL